MVRIASSSEVLPWSTWPITVTTGGRGRICAGSDSSSSSTSPSIERTCTSKWNLSATSLAAVGSSTSLTVAITPRSTNALITSVVLWRIAAASSPTVTDSGSLISSRLISCGGSGGGGRAPPGPGVSAADGGAGDAGAAAGAATAAGRAGAAGRGGARGAAGRGGEITVRGGFSGGATGARLTGGAGLSSTGGAVAAGRTAGVGAGGAVGLGGASGGAGATAAAGTSGGAGAISGGAAGGTTDGAGRKMVAAGFAASSAGASSTTARVSATVFAAVFFARAGVPSPAAFFFGATAGASPSAAFGLGARLGLASAGRSRPRPSLTRSSLAVAVRRGLMARMPLWPMPSSATIRSLLVTPSSFARSMTFTRAATRATSSADSPE